MSWWQGFKQFMARSKRLVPGVGGRVSIPLGGTSSSALIETFITSVNGVAAKFPFEVYETMDNMFMISPYFSKYLATTLALGNTGHKLSIQAGTEKRAKEALQCANDFAARCFPGAGGLDGVVNGCLSQVARAGGLCCEWVPNKAITQVERAYLVPIKTLRFRFNKDKELELCQLQTGQLVPLNMLQTTFHVAVPWDDNPYPMPPALSALQAAARLHKFDASLDGWLEKLAALGVFMAQVERPPYGDARDQTEYERKSAERLDGIAKALSENLKKGFVVGFDDIEFKFQNTTAAAPGAKDLLQMVLQAVFAGLGRDPVFFGWNWSSTETYSTVVFEELVAGIINQRMGAKRGLEHGHRMNFAISGLGDVGVSAAFNPNRSLDKFMHSESRQMDTNALATLFDRDIVDRDEVRRDLGFDEHSAAADAFVASFNKASNSYTLHTPERRIWTGSNAAAGIEIVEIEHGAREARNAARKYLFEIQSELSDAAQIGIQAVYEWAKQRDIPEEETFVSRVLELFLKGAEGSLDSATLERIAREHLSSVWEWARYEDDSIFGPDWDRNPRGPGVTLGAWDETAINYMSRVDRFYVSKYVSGDERTSEQIRKFLREQYLERGLGRGKSPKELNRFRDEFGALVDRIGEHRSRVIIDTGVSRAQNWGEVIALDDEAIAKFRIAGPWDRLTCGWCYAMKGRVWIVKTEVKRIEKIIASGDEDIAQFDKFITSRFGGKSGLEYLRSLSDADVQATGMVTAPIHPQCRHRTLAVIE